VHGYLVAPECPEYDSISQNTGLIRKVARHAELVSHDFSELLREMGATVSMTPASHAPTSANPNLYGL
jgi:hypothetical protein